MIDVPRTEAEWLAFGTFITRYRDESGNEMMVVPLARYEMLLRLAKTAPAAQPLASLNEPHS